MANRANREQFTICMKSSLAECMRAELKEQKMYKSTLIQRALIEKLSFSEKFRKMALQSLDEQGRDLDYYEIMRAFEELDGIKWTYQDATSKIVKIFLDRI